MSRFRKHFTLAVLGLAIGFMVGARLTEMYLYG